ncbi:MAG: hypothetical protein Q8O14_06030 [bacterium]|jgi:hypothetical protein|nr:hypothetical protein [bacterium]
MSRPEAFTGREGPDLEQGVERDLRLLEEVWRDLEPTPAPSRLVRETLSRLRREGVEPPVNSRPAWRTTLSTGLGLAAALLLVAGLWQARERLGQGPSARPGGRAEIWAEGLVLAERFESLGQELEARLARVSRELALEDLAFESVGDAAGLRQRLDQLAEDMEAF